MGRKAKATPASSAKALEVCGDTSRLGVSAADVFAQFGGPAFVSDEAVACGPALGVALPSNVVPPLDDAEVSVLLHALQKKDPTTRLRGVADLKELLASRPAAALRDVCAPFLHIYRRLWPQDAEPRVREGLQRCLQVLVEGLQREFARHLRSAFPIWLCAMFDTHAEVAQAARKSFAATFTSDEKRRGVFRHCQTDCLALFTANIRHSEQSLHEELGITGANAPSDKNAALERQDRYARVIAASLNALGELVHVCAVLVPSSSSSTAPLTASELEPFFTQGSACALWPRLAAKQPPLVRRAVAECLVRVLQSPARREAWASASTRSAVVNTLADDAVPSATAAALLRSFVAAGGSTCWAGLVASKSLWPQLLAIIKRGAPRHTGFLAELPALLEALPLAAWEPGRGEALLRALMEALRVPCGANATEVWHAYFTVVQAADSAAVPVGCAWRWHPVKLYLASACGGSAPDSGAAGQGSVDDSSQDAPPGSVSAGALAVIPSVVESKLPQLLVRAEAGDELLDVLTAGAPDFSAGPAAGIPVVCWSKWIALLAPLLGDSPSVPAGLRANAAELLARQVRSIMVAAFRWPVADGVAGALPLLEALGKALTTDSVTVDRSWAPSENVEVTSSHSGAAVDVTPPQSTKVTPEWPAEAALLEWPLLPWCRSWLIVDVLAASALSKHVLRPLLHSAVKRHGSVFPAHAVRDLMITTLLAPPVLSEEAGSPGLRTPCFSAAVQLILECSPGQLELAAAPAFQRAVARLTSMFARGESSVETALQLALRPGSLAPEVVHESLGVLVQALQANMKGDPRVTSAQTLRVSLFCAGILVAHESEAKTRGLEAKVDSRSSLAAFRGPVCTMLLGSLVGGCSMDSQATAAAWALLPSLLGGVDTSVVCEAIGAPPEADEARRRWVQALHSASATFGMPSAALLCQCRSGTGGLRMRGPVVLGDLRRCALATSHLLHSGGLGGLELASQGCLTESMAALLWELLLARVVVPEVASGAALATTWLSATRAGVRGQLARFCSTEAAEEGHAWWLIAHRDSKEPAADGVLPAAACLHGLAVLKLVLREAWPNLAAADEAQAQELLCWALEDASRDRGTSPGWGQVVAAIVERCAELGIHCILASRETSARVVRAEWREAIQKASTSRELSVPLLCAAAAVERWVSKLVADSQHVAEAGVERAAPGSGHEGPVIAERPADSLAAVASGPSPAEIAEELDTGLIEAHEQLLRWVQTARQAMGPGDAFADYAASTWPAIAVASPDLSSTSRIVTRMHRLVLELLGDSREEDQVRVSPGALRLITALAKARMWPDSCWTAVLQAIARVNIFLAEARRGSSQLSGLPISHGFTNEVAAAAADVLRCIPAASVPKAVTFLAATDLRLQTAAAVRLRAHDWVPLKREAVLEGHPREVLKQLEALLQEEEVGADAQSAPSKAVPGPSCNDVAFTVLVAIVGRELAVEAWAVDAALGAFLAWEAEAEASEARGSESGSSDSEPGPGAGKAGASCGSTTGRRMMPGSKGCTGEAGPEMPPDCQRRCLAALAAWELLLIGAQEQERSVDGSEGSTPPAQPPELLVAALQLAPDQLAGLKAAQGWKAGAAPAVGKGASVMHSLLQLLCHVLTCEHLVGTAGAEEQLRRVLAAAVAGGGDQGPPVELSVFALAARVLLLAFQALPGAVRSFWEALPRRRDRDIVERLVARSFAPLLVQSEAAAATAQLEAQRERLSDIEASIARRSKQLVLQLGRDDLRTELCVQLPDSFPLRTATAEQPEKVPGIPKPRLRNWMLQARQVLAGPRPMGVGRVMLMWARSFSLFFEGVEDCPICYNVVHLSTQTIPRKACPTCKHKFHNECLYHWFKTSAKTTCPLCNQPF